MQDAYRIRLNTLEPLNLPGYRLDTRSSIYICVDPNKETAEVSNDTYHIQCKYPKEGKPFNDDATILLTAAIRITGDAYAAYQAIKSIL